MDFQVPKNEHKFLKHATYTQKEAKQLIWQKNVNTLNTYHIKI